jgi:hypothetical protein
VSGRAGSRKSAAFRLFPSPAQFVANTADGMNQAQCKAVINLASKVRLAGTRGTHSGNKCAPRRSIECQPQSTGYHSFATPARPQFRHAEIWTAVPVEDYGVDSAGVTAPFVCTIPFTVPQTVSNLQRESSLRGSAPSPFPHPRRATACRWVC